MRLRSPLSFVLFLLVSSFLTGCGAVWVNQGAPNYSLNFGMENPAAARGTKNPELKDAVAVFVDDGVAAIYPYNGAIGSMSDEEVYSGKAALKCVLNPADYSGVICDTGQALDIAKAREDGYVLRFYAKGAKGGEPIMISLNDTKDDSQEVEVSVTLTKYGKLTTEWQKIEIPLKDFPSVGGYWDGSKIVDGVNVQWNKMGQFRVKDNKTGGPQYTVYVDEVAVVPPGK